LSRRCRGRLSRKGRDHHDEKNQSRMKRRRVLAGRMARRQNPQPRRRRRSRPRGCVPSDFGPRIAFRAYVPARATPVGRLSSRGGASTPHRKSPPAPTLPVASRVAGGVPPGGRTGIRSRRTSIPPNFEEAVGAVPYGFFAFHGVNRVRVRAILGRGGPADAIIVRALTNDGTIEFCSGSSSKSRRRCSVVSYRRQSGS